MRDAAPTVIDRGEWPPARQGSYRSETAKTSIAALILVVLLALVGLAIAVPTAALVVVGVCAVAIAAFVLRRTEDLTLHLLVASVFVESLSIAGLSIGRLLAALVVVVIIWRVTLTAWRPRIVAPLAFLPVLAYAGWLLASGYWAQNQSGWIFAVGQLGLALAFFAGFALLVQTPEQVTRLLRTFVCGAVLAGVLGIVQALYNQRAAGLQGDPNLYAVYQVAAIPAALALARQSLHHRRWWAAAVIPLVGSIFASDSRGGLIAVVVVLLYMLFRGQLTTRIVRRPHPLNMLLVVVAVVVAGLVATSLNSRLDFSRIGQDRGSGRLDIWYAAWKAFLRDPLIGIGGGNFKVTSIHLLQTTPGVQLVKSHLLLSPGIEVHNVYLETITEYGVIGAIIYVVLLVSAFRNLRWAERHFSEPSVVALTPMLLAFTIASIFLSVSNSKLFWMLVGLSVAFRSMPYLQQTFSRGRDAGIRETGAAPLR